MKEIHRHADAQIVAVCDLDTKRWARRSNWSTAATARRRTSRTPARSAISTHRELLANKDIDAVLISTPDHQHARLAVQAVQAGKTSISRSPRR
jgi:predicted dehydrogenase